MHPNKSNLIIHIHPRTHTHTQTHARTQYYASNASGHVDPQQVNSLPLDGARVQFMSTDFPSSLMELI